MYPFQFFLALAKNKFLVMIDFELVRNIPNNFLCESLGE
jgi:hypothetical protein